MFEQGLAFLLKKVLGEFVEDGSAWQEKIQLGVWSGLIVLENLVLKSSIFALVDVPISLSFGSIGRLELRIPWGNLGVEPVSIIIDKVNILIEPKYEWNPGASEKREQAVKQAKLTATEVFANKRLTASTSGSYRDIAMKWFLTSFINKIVDNIQITIREVHVRYEDQLSCPSNFCIGFSFESLHIQSRDRSFSFEENYSPTKPVFNQSSDTDIFGKAEKEMVTHGFETFFKLIQLNHVALYWNPLVPGSSDVCTCCYVGRTTAEIQSYMSLTVAKRTHQFFDRPRHHYILLPADINSFLDMSFNAGTGVAKANVKLFIKDISIAFEDRQFREIISMSINMSNFAKLERFSEFRPNTSVWENPIAWWQYAINAVIVQLRIERKKTFTWKRLKRRADDRLVYVELWKSKVMTPQVPLNALNLELDKEEEDEEARIKSGAGSVTSEYLKLRENRMLHRDANVEYQRIFKRAKRLKTSAAAATVNANNRSSRSAAASVGKPLTKDTLMLLRKLERDLSFEDIVLFRSLAEEELSHEVIAENHSWLGGAYSWITGGKSNATVSEEAKRKLFEALKYDPDRVFRGGKTLIDPDEVGAIVSIHLHKGSVTVALSTPDVSSKSIPFLKLEMTDLKTRTVLMGDGSHVRMQTSLQDFEAFEIVPSRQQRQQQQQLDHNLVMTGTTTGVRNTSPFRGSGDGSWSPGSTRGRTGDSSSSSSSSSGHHRGSMETHSYKRIMFRRIQETSSSLKASGSHTILSSAGGGSDGWEVSPASTTAASTSAAAPHESSGSSTRGRGESVASIHSSSSSGTSGGGGGFGRRAAPLSPLFTVTIETTPSNKEQEVTMHLNMEKLEVLVSPAAKWLESFATFTTWPQDLKYWSEMEMNAMNQLADLKSRVDAKLQYMLNNHKNIFIEARIDAPIIVVSDLSSPSPKTSDVLVIDLGVIVLSTEKLAKAQFQKDLLEKSAFMNSSYGLNSSYATGTPMVTPSVARTNAAAAIAASGTAAISAKVQSLSPLPGGGGATVVEALASGSLKGESHAGGQSALPPFLSPVKETRSETQSTLQSAADTGMQTPVVVSPVSGAGNRSSEPTYETVTADRLYQLNSRRRKISSAEKNAEDDQLSGDGGGGGGSGGRDGHDGAIFVEDVDVEGDNDTGTDYASVVSCSESGRRKESIRNNSPMQDASNKSNVGVAAEENGKQAGSGDGISAGPASHSSAPKSTSFAATKDQGATFTAYNNSSRYRGSGGAFSPGMNRGAYANTITTNNTGTVNGLDNVEDASEELFDIFQLQMSQITTYLVAAQYLHKSQTVIDANKTVIVDKLVIAVEIQVSVLPWDVTIPPAKLLVDIPEVHVRLSPAKLSRLKRFGDDLAGAAAAAAACGDKQDSLGAKTREKLSRLSAVMARSGQSSEFSNSFGGGGLAAAAPSRSKLRESMGETRSSNRLSGSFVRSRAGSMSRSRRGSFNEGHSTASGAAADKRRGSSVSSRSEKSASQRRNLKAMRKSVEDVCIKVNSDDEDGNGNAKSAGGSRRTRSSRDLIDSDDALGDDDSDCDSFFSVDNTDMVGEHTRQLESLLSSIQMKENTASSLMSEIRTTESDLAKSSLHDFLRKQLTATEREIKDLKTSYVEMLVDGQLMMSASNLSGGISGGLGLGGLGIDYSEDIDGTAAADYISPINSNRSSYHDAGGKIIIPKKMQEFLDQLVVSDNINKNNQARLGRKRNLIHASVFKIEPSHYENKKLHIRTQDGALQNGDKRELVFVKINIADVIVDLQCECNSDYYDHLKIVNPFNSRAPFSGAQGPSMMHSPHHLHQQLPTHLVYRLEVAGISIKLRHRDVDTKASFVIKELSARDFPVYPAQENDQVGSGLTGASAGGGGSSSSKTGTADGDSSRGLNLTSRIDSAARKQASSREIILSSDPVTFGIFSSPLASNHLMQGATDLLKIKYNVVYSTTEEVARSPSSGVGASSSSQYVEDIVYTVVPTNHSIKAHMGFIGINIEQSSLALLLCSLHGVLVDEQSAGAATATAATGGGGGGSASAAAAAADINAAGSKREERTSRENENASEKQQHSRSTSFVEDLSSAAHAAAAAAEDDDGASPPPAFTSPPNFNLSLVFKMDCMSLTLLDRMDRPRFSCSIWSLSNNVQVNQLNVSTSMRLADLTMSHHVVNIAPPPSAAGSSRGAQFPFSPSASISSVNNKSNATTTEHSLFCKRADCLLPFLASSTRFDFHEDFNLGDLHTVLRVAPIAINVVPERILELLSDLKKGSVATTILKLSPIRDASSEAAAAAAAASKLKQSSSGKSSLNMALLDATMNPLLDLCNGRVDISMGGVECLLTANGSGFVGEDSASHVALLVQSLDSSIVWGQQAQSTGVEACVNVTGMEVSVAQCPVLRSFSISLVASGLPKTLIPYGSAEDGGNEVVRGAGVEQMYTSLSFPPPFLPDICANEVQISIGVSPLLIHCNELVIFETSQWILATEQVWKRIGKLMEGPAGPASAAASLPPPSSSYYYYSAAPRGSSGGGGGTYRTHATGGSAASHLHNIKNISQHLAALLGTSANIAADSSSSDSSSFVTPVPEVPSPEFNVSVAILLHELAVSIEVNKAKSGIVGYTQPVNAGALVSAANRRSDSPGGSHRRRGGGGGGGGFTAGASGTSDGGGGGTGDDAASNRGSSHYRQTGYQSHQYQYSQQQQQHHPHAHDTQRPAHTHMSTAFKLTIGNITSTLEMRVLPKHDSAGDIGGDGTSASASCTEEENESSYAPASTPVSPAAPASAQLLLRNWTSIKSVDFEYFLPQSDPHHSSYKRLFCTSFAPLAAEVQADTSTTTSSAHQFPPSAGSKTSTPDSKWSNTGPKQSQHLHHQQEEHLMWALVELSTRKDLDIDVCLGHYHITLIPEAVSSLHQIAEVYSQARVWGQEPAPASPRHSSSGGGSGGGYRDGGGYHASSYGPSSGKSSGRRPHWASNGGHGDTPPLLLTSAPYMSSGVGGAVGGGAGTMRPAMRGGRGEEQTTARYAAIYQHAFKAAASGGSRTASSRSGVGHKANSESGYGSNGNLNGAVLRPVSPAALSGHDTDYDNSSGGRNKAARSFDVEQSGAHPSSVPMASHFVDASLLQYAATMDPAESGIGKKAASAATATLQHQGRHGHAATGSDQFSSGHSRYDRSSSPTHESLSSGDDKKQKSFVLMTPASLSLPPALRSINMRFMSHSSGIWIPSAPIKPSYTSSNSSGGRGRTSGNNLSSSTGVSHTPRILPSSRSLDNLSGEVGAAREEGFFSRSTSGGGGSDNKTRKQQTTATSNDDNVLRGHRRNKLPQATALFISMDIGLLANSHNVKCHPLADGTLYENNQPFWSTQCELSHVNVALSRALPAEVQQHVLIHSKLPAAAAADSSTGRGVSPAVPPNPVVPVAEEDHRQSMPMEQQVTLSNALYVEDLHDSLNYARDGVLATLLLPGTGTGIGSSTGAGSASKAQQNKQSLSTAGNKQLILPFSLHIVHTMQLNTDDELLNHLAAATLPTFISMDGVNNNNNRNTTAALDTTVAEISTGTTHLEVVQKVQVSVDRVEMQVFLDARPFVEIFSFALDPLQKYFTEAAKRPPAALPSARKSAGSRGSLYGGSGNGYGDGYGSFYGGGFNDYRYSGGSMSGGGSSVTSSRRPSHHTSVGGGGSVTSGRSGVGTSVLSAEHLKGKREAFTRSNSGSKASAAEPSTAFAVGAGAGVGRSALPTAQQPSQQQQQQQNQRPPMRLNTAATPPKPKSGSSSTGPGVSMPPTAGTATPSGAKLHDPEVKDALALLGLSANLQPKRAEYVISTSDSFFDTLALLGELSRVEASVKLNRLRVNVVNDIYQQPVTVTTADVSEFAVDALVLRASSICRPIVAFPVRQSAAGFVDSTTSTRAGTANGTPNITPNRTTRKSAAAPVDTTPATPRNFAEGLTALKRTLSSVKLEGISKVTKVLNNVLGSSPPPATTSRSTSYGGGGAEGGVANALDEKNEESEDDDDESVVDRNHIGDIRAALKDGIAGNVHNASNNGQEENRNNNQTSQELFEELRGDYHSASAAAIASLPPMSAFVEMNIKCDYYNQTLMAMEPLIEKFRLSVGYSAAPPPPAIAASAATQPLQPIYFIVDGAPTSNSTSSNSRANRNNHAVLRAVENSVIGAMADCYRWNVLREISDVSSPSSSAAAPNDENTTSPLFADYSGKEENGDNNNNNNNLGDSDMLASTMTTASEQVQLLTVETTVNSRLNTNRESSSSSSSTTAHAAESAAAVAVADDMESAQAPTLRVDLPDGINVNVTTALVEIGYITAMAIVNTPAASSSAPASSAAADQRSTGKADSLMTIRNECGLPLQYWQGDLNLFSTHKYNPDSSVATNYVPSSTEVPLFVDFTTSLDGNRRYSSSAGSGPHSRYLNFGFGTTATTATFPSPVSASPPTRPPPQNEDNNNNSQRWFQLKQVPLSGSSSTCRVYGINLNRGSSYDEVKKHQQHLTATALLRSSITPYGSSRSRFSSRDDTDTHSSGLNAAAAVGGMFDETKSVGSRTSRRSGVGGAGPRTRSPSEKRAKKPRKSFSSNTDAGTPVSRAQRLLPSSDEDAAGNGTSTALVVVELLSHNGSKTLLVRSTMCVRNVTRLTYKLQLVCAAAASSSSSSSSSYSPSEGASSKPQHDSGNVELFGGGTDLQRSVLWEAVIPPQKCIFLPANMCQMFHSRILLTPVFESKTSSEQPWSENVGAHHYGSSGVGTGVLRSPKSRFPAQQATMRGSGGASSSSFAVGADEVYTAHTSLPHYSHNLYRLTQQNTPAEIPVPLLPNQHKFLRTPAGVNHTKINHNNNKNVGNGVNSGGISDGDDVSVASGSRSRGRSSSRTRSRAGSRTVNADNTTRWRWQKGGAASSAARGAASFASSSFSGAGVESGAEANGGTGRRTGTAEGGAGGEKVVFGEGEEPDGVYPPGGASNSSQPLSNEESYAHWVRFTSNNGGCVQTAAAAAAQSSAASTSPLKNSRQSGNNTTPSSNDLWHELRKMADSVHCNVDVLSVGGQSLGGTSNNSSNSSSSNGASGAGSGASSSTGAGSCGMLRTLTLSSPVRVVNLMACCIEVVILPSRIMQGIQSNIFVDENGFSSSSSSSSSAAFGQYSPHRRNYTSKEYKSGTEESKAGNQQHNHPQQHNVDISSLLYDNSGYPTNINPLIPRATLPAGESWDCAVFHATENIELCLRLKDDTSCGQRLWSLPVSIPGCSIVPSSTTTFAVDVKFKNGSALTVNLEVSDDNGCRTINVFVPFWVVSSSFLPLQFKHDIAASNSSSETVQTAGGDLLNGIDGLAADQHFDPPMQQGGSAFTSADNARGGGGAGSSSSGSGSGSVGNGSSTGGGASGAQRRRPRGFGRARGSAGVVLGPDVPLRGFAEALGSPSLDDQRSILSPLQWGEYRPVPSALQLAQGGEDGARRAFSRNGTDGGYGAEGGSEWGRQQSYDGGSSSPYYRQSGGSSQQVASNMRQRVDLPFRLMQCGYSNSNGSTVSTTDNNNNNTNNNNINNNTNSGSVPVCKLRFKSDSSLWSDALSVDSTVVTVPSKPLSMSVKAMGEDVDVVDSPRDLSGGSSLRLNNSNSADIAAVGALSASHDHARDGEGGSGGSGGGSSSSRGYEYTFGVSWVTASAPFNRTKILTITDRYSLINNTGLSIEVLYQRDNVFSLRPGAEVPLWGRVEQPTSFWGSASSSSSQSRGESRLVQMRLARYGWSWSGKFSIDVEGEVNIRLRNDFDNTVYFVLVHVVKIGSRCCAIFKGGDKYTPYRFENYTLDTFKISQKGNSQLSQAAFHTNLLPYHCCAYAWDQPLAEHSFSIEVLRNSSHSHDEWVSLGGDYSFDRLGSHYSTRRSKSRSGSFKPYLHMRVVAKGPTRVFQLFDVRGLRQKLSLLTTPSLSVLPPNSIVNNRNNSANSVYRMNQQSTAATSVTASALDTPAGTRKIALQLIVNVRSAGVSIIDHYPEELLYIHISGIRVKHRVAIADGAAVDTMTAFTIDYMQIDNQLAQTPFPSLLRTHTTAASGSNLMVSPATNTGPEAHTDQSVPFISLELKRDFEYFGIEYIPLLKLDIAPYEINLEGMIVQRLVNMGKVAMSYLSAEGGGGGGGRTAALGMRNCSITAVLRLSDTVPDYYAPNGTISRQPQEQEQMNNSAFSATSLPEESDIKGSPMRINGPVAASPASSTQVNSDAAAASPLNNANNIASLSQQQQPPAELIGSIPVHDRRSAVRNKIIEAQKPNSSGGGGTGTVGSSAASGLGAALRAANNNNNTAAAPNTDGPRNHLNYSVRRLGPVAQQPALAQAEGEENESAAAQAPQQQMQQALQLWSQDAPSREQQHHQHHQHQLRPVSNPSSFVGGNNSRTSYGYYRGRNSVYSAMQAAAAADQSPSAADVLIQDLLHTLNVLPHVAKKTGTNKIYLERVDISELVMHLSINPRDIGTLLSYLLDVDSRAKLSLPTLVGSIVNPANILSGVKHLAIDIVTWFVPMLLTFESCPLAFEPYHIDHLFETQEDVAKHTIRNYTKPIVYQSLKVFFTRSLGNLFDQKSSAVRIVPAMLLHMCSGLLTPAQVLLIQLGVVDSYDFRVAGGMNGSDNDSSRAGNKVTGFGAVAVAAGAPNDEFSNAIVASNTNANSSGSSSSSSSSSAALYDNVLDDNEGGDLQNSDNDDGDAIDGVDNVTFRANNMANAVDYWTQETTPSSSGSGGRKAFRKPLPRPTSVWHGCKAAVMGMTRDPIYGWRTEGFNGFILGVLKGILGLVGRPLYGLLGDCASGLDALSQLFVPRSRIKHQQQLRMLRYREPRYFNPCMPVLLPYDAECNTGLQFLARTQHGAFLSEGYAWHAELVLPPAEDQEQQSSMKDNKSAKLVKDGIGSNKSTSSSLTTSGGNHLLQSGLFLICTRERLLCVLATVGSKQCVVQWECRLRNLQSVEITFDNTAVPAPSTASNATRLLSVADEMKLSDLASITDGAIGTRASASRTADAGAAFSSSSSLLVARHSSVFYKLRSAMLNSEARLEATRGLVCGTSTAAGATGDACSSVITNNNIIKNNDHHISSRPMRSQGQGLGQCVEIRFIFYDHGSIGSSSSSSSSSASSSSFVGALKKSNSGSGGSSSGMNINTANRVLKLENKPVLLPGHVHMVRVLQHLLRSVPSLTTSTQIASYVRQLRGADTTSAAAATAMMATAAAAAQLQAGVQVSGGPSSTGGIVVNGKKRERPVHPNVPPPSSVTGVRNVQSSSK